MKRLLIGVLVIALALAIGGCKAISEKVGEEVGEEIAGGIMGGDVEVEGDEVTIKTENGESTIASTDGEMPKDFPDDFPVYEGADVGDTSSFANETDNTYYVNLLTDDDVKDVYEWYKAEFTDGGWTIEGDLMFSDGESGDSGMLTVTKDEKMNATVTLGKGAKGSEIGIILMVTK